jgi:hypothetical protein
MLGLVTCAVARDADTELPLLAPHLPESAVVEWHDPAVDWARFDAVTIRSAWDYADRPDDFVAWAAEHVARVFRSLVT